MVSLVEHGRIRTTLAKAKELRRHIEPAITLGKKADVASRRLLLSRIPNEQTVSKIISEISKNFADRNGGYTRIIKLDQRPGDKSEMAFLEFVNYDWKADATKKSTKVADKKTSGAKSRGKSSEKKSGAGKKNKETVTTA
jgi:large subunit ribosomal protein L17